MLRDGEAIKGGNEMNQRIELLNQQNALHNQHCVTCPNRYDRNAKSCKSCDIFIKFNEIGNSLLKRHDVKELNKKTKNDILAESMTAHGMVLTIDRYLDLQEMGLKNYQIADYYGITTQELNEWKVWQGLTGKRGPVSKKDLA